MVPSCTKCGRSIFASTQKGIVCQSYGAVTSSFLCECGYVSGIFTEDDFLSVILKDDFTTSIVQELQTLVPSVSLSSNEYLAVHGGYLHIMNAEGYKRLNSKDISTDLTQNMANHTATVLKRLNEKCNNHPTNEMCQACKYAQITSIDDLKCLQQLFCIFADFMPKPHQGQEYGDISLSVMLEGRQSSFQGIMKSQTNKVTRSSTVGREITDQVIKRLMDSRTSIIGVIVPAILDEQLTETLSVLAKCFCKK